MCTLACRRLSVKVWHSVLRMEGLSIMKCYNYYNHYNCYNCYNHYNYLRGSYRRSVSYNSYKSYTTSEGCNYV